MIDFMNRLRDSFVYKIYSAFTRFANKYLFSATVFFMRCWIARIFWYSGLTKIDSWETTLMLFEYEYAVPVIPEELAAILATAAELSMPVLLLIGLMSRFAAIPLLFMTAVIQFTYLDLIDHLYWALLLCTIIFYGPGRYSLDHLLVCMSKNQKGE